MYSLNIFNIIFFETIDFSNANLNYKISYNFPVFIIKKKNTRICQIILNACNIFKKDNFKLNLEKNYTCLY